MKLWEGVDVSRREGSVFANSKNSDRRVLFLESRRGTFFQRKLCVGEEVGPNAEKQLKYEINCGMKKMVGLNMNPYMCSLF